ncbi:hypothetical protein MW7_009130 [Imbroritus primus]|uniref:Uncharacterized protein n=1 Tax=Imbroritus primus TaxID=3058603 RepID=A0ACD3SRN8_9BURK|nr:hypothetical protein MW7_009130 [Burkholderiaceae bacterium PBA]
MSVPRTSLAAMALGCAICFAGAAAWAQPAGEQVLSTQDLTVTEGAFGLNDAIQAGEMRRRTAAGPQASAPQPLAPEPAYARYPQYKGTIGDVPIRMRLGPKPDERDSVHGEYHYGTSRAVQRVAGEYADGTFLMEESDDGTTVTGMWEGQIDARGVVRGQWTDAFDRRRILPFVLVPVTVTVIPPYRSDDPAYSNAAPIAAPAPMPAPRAPALPATPGPARSSIIGW